jgi:hypothetical protein
MKSIRKKGQMTSMEVVIIVALILFFSVPFISNLLTNLSVRVTTEKMASSAVEISQAIEQVANLGEGNSKTVYTSYPVKIENLGVEGSILTVIGNEEESNVQYKLLPNINDVPKVNPGTLKIIKTSDGVAVEKVPEIIKITPSAGPSGAKFTVNGMDFDENTVVNYDNGYIRTTYISSTKLTINPTASYPGSYPVYVMKSVANEEMTSNTVYVTVGTMGGPGS